MTRSLIAAALSLGLAGPALALQPLHEDKFVLQSFYTLGFADTLRKKCDDISPRVVNAYSFLRNLQKYARDQGYSDDQIDALLENKAEKNKLKVRIEADLAARGATPETPEGYCTVGREEIAKGSAAGKLLRAR